MNKATLNQWLSAISGERWQSAIRFALKPIWDRYSTRPLNSAGLVIHGSASTVAKTGSSDFYYLANGLTGKIAASTDMPALVGTVANATFNVFCFFVDQVGNVTSQMGVAGASLSAMKWPSFPTEKALIGAVLINPTGTGNFVGGTTALDDGTVVPGAVYLSGIGGFDPSCTLGPL